MEFSRQGYWSGLPFPPPGDLPDPGIKPGSPESPAVSLPLEPPGKLPYVAYKSNKKSGVVDTGRNVSMRHHRRDNLRKSDCEVS